MTYKTVSIIAKLALLLFALLIALMLNSCVSFKKCQEKYGSKYTDTTFVTVSDTVRIDKDSISVSYRNDTIFHKVIERGNTILTIQKEPKYTYVTCETKEIQKVITLQAKCPPVAQFWGVSPNWKTAVYVLSGALLLALICLLILFFIKRNNLSIFNKP